MDEPVRLAFQYDWKSIFTFVSMVACVIAFCVPTTSEYENKQLRRLRRLVDLLSGNFKKAKNKNKE